MQLLLEFFRFRPDRINWKAMDVDSIYIESEGQTTEASGDHLYAIKNELFPEFVEHADC